MGCTVDELGRRISAQEFAEWQIVFAHEQLHPGVWRMRHAQVMAALYTGPATRKGGGQWRAGDFMSDEPWRPRHVSRKPTTGAQVAAFAAAHNARRKLS